jgi:hypothetical protein
LRESLGLLVPPVPRGEPDIPDPDDPEEPDIPDPDDPEEPDIPDPDEPDDPGRPDCDEADDPERPDCEEPDDPEKPDESLLDELEDPLRPLCPLMPERFVSPASSSEADGTRLLPEALRELPSPGDALSRMPPCDDEPDCPCRADEPDC